jgi:hypothetical protein
MLANRADTYNLGDVLGGKEELFSLSYLENALTSHPVLAPLSGRDPKDLEKLVRIARGEGIPTSELAYGYSAAELADIVAMLKLLARVQDVLLRVNQTYIRSASQEDAYRTEPPFKLQGSYRNMNKITQKLAPVMTVEELDRAIDEHYAAESQTLTTGAEQNLLKLAELRGKLTETESARLRDIREAFVRTRRGGKEGDDPVSRVTSSIAGLEEQLQTLVKRLGEAQATLAEGRRETDASLASALAKLGEASAKRQDVRVTLENPHPQVVELEAIVQLGQAMANAVSRVSGPDSGASRAIVEKLAELEAMLERRSSVARPVVEVDLRKRDATNLICDAAGVVSGVFVGTYAKAPPLRSEVHLQLVFPANHTAAAKGLVAFVQDEDGDRPAGYGVTFTELSPEARPLLVQYTKNRDPVLYEV